MTNLKFEKSYGEFYFDTFTKALIFENITTAERKYNFKKNQ